MYSNNILNFQESTTILNACKEKKSGNLLNTPRNRTSGDHQNYSIVEIFQNTEESPGVF